MGYGYGYGPWGMMNGWGYGGYGFGLLHMAFWLVILIAIVLGLIWLGRSVAGSQSVPPHRSVGLNVLEERYARGEIKRDEYLEKKRDIAG